MSPASLMAARIIEASLFGLGLAVAIFALSIALALAIAAIRRWLDRRFMRPVLAKLVDEKRLARNAVSRM